MDIQKRFEVVSRSKTFNRIVKEFDLGNKKVLDIGCGYGEHLAHFGVGSAGITITKTELDYTQKRGLNVFYGDAEAIERLYLDSDFDAIWANNFFEHILSPHTFLMKLKKFSQNNTLLILGVPVIPAPICLTKLEKFRGALAVSHINFFTKDTLKLNVERAGWRVKDLRSFVFSNRFFDNPFSFIAPHLYVIAEDNADFKYHDKKITEWGGEERYKILLETTGQK